MNLTGAKPRGLKERKDPPPLNKPWGAIPKVSAKTKARKSSADGRAGAAFMAWVAQQPCVICGDWPVHVHHCICGRYGQRKASDFDTVPLCPDCHQGPQGIHADKRAWIERHGVDTDYIKMPPHNEL